MISSIQAPRRAGPAALFAFAILIVFSTALPGTQAQGVLKGDNPWHRTAVHDTDDEHAHQVMEPSPFDGMSGLQLAAVPKGNRIHYRAPSNCVPSRLKSVLQRVAAKYGPITVNSTYRNSGKNRKVGGKKRSYHLTCAAIDFRVHGPNKGLLSYLSKQGDVGGYKRYKSGFYHIDTGPRRTW